MKCWIILNATGIHETSIVDDEEPASVRVFRKVYFEKETAEKALLRFKRNNADQTLLLLESIATAEIVPYQKDNITQWAKIISLIKDE